MNSLFDNADKTVKIHEKRSNKSEIKCVLNPYDRTFIDEQLAIDLGIIFSGYYRNSYGGLIPLPIAASKGYIQYETTVQIEIEYCPRQYPIKANLIIHQVYDPVHQYMIPCQQALDRGFLNIESFSYVSTNATMAIHDAFYRGFILGDLRTSAANIGSFHYVDQRKQDVEYDNLFSSLTNIINSLTEFRNTINIIDECELTSDGFIRHKKTDKCYLLTQAIELGLVSMKDIQIKSEINNTFQVRKFDPPRIAFFRLRTEGELNGFRKFICLFTQESIVVNDISTYNRDLTVSSDETRPYFSDTFIFDLLTSTSHSIDESQQDEVHSTTLKRFLPMINTC